MTGGASGVGDDILRHIVSNSGHHSQMTTVSRAYADGPFGQIHYRIARGPAEGSATPLVCLHQSPKSGRDFEKLIGRLGRSRTCIAPDTPGYGASDAPAEQPMIADYGRSLLHLIDGLQARGEMPAGPFDLMGYHTGSAITAWTARHAPDRVRKLVFVSLPVLEPELRKARLAVVDGFPVPREDGSNITQLLKIAETLNDARHGPEWRHQALGECLRSGSRLPWGFRAVYSQDVGADLAELAQQALILCPKDDLWDETQAAAHLVRNGRLLPLPDVANGFLDLDTDQAAATIAAFLDA